MNSTESDSPPVPIAFCLDWPLVFGVVSKMFLLAAIWEFTIDSSRIALLHRKKSECLKTKMSVQDESLKPSQ